MEILVSHDLKDMFLEKRRIILVGIPDEIINIMGSGQEAACGFKTPIVKFMGRIRLNFLSSLKQKSNL